MAKEKRVTVYFDRETEEFVGLTPLRMNELMQAFPGINITVELMCMKEWLVTDAGKDRVGTMLFILNWLKRSKASNPPSPVPDNVDPILQPLVSEYLVELWQKNRNLLEMNMMSPMMAFVA